MWLNHVTQVDAPTGRFWMDLCAGRDQVAMQVHQKGWASYEPPLPSFLATCCARLSPLVVDVGANTGFYSLLCASSGAKQVLAVEPVQEIADVLAANVALSELTDCVQLLQVALGEQVGQQVLHFPLADHGLLETSASLNPNFRAQHSQQRTVPVHTLDKVLADHMHLAGEVPLLIKMDVESLELAVLAGGEQVLKQWRPAVVAEILPGANVDAWQQFMQRWGYVHYALQPDAPYVSAQPATIKADMAVRDHLFLPKADVHQWFGTEKI
jgi:FkbM family methyltransferase